jgi:hypothetical protein
MFKLLSLSGAKTMCRGSKMPYLPGKDKTFTSRVNIDSTIYKKPIVYVSVIVIT